MTYEYCLTMNLLPKILIAFILAAGLVSVSASEVQANHVPTNAEAEYVSAYWLYYNSGGLPYGLYGCHLIYYKRHCDVWIKYYNSCLIVTHDSQFRVQEVWGVWCSDIYGGRRL